MNILEEISELCRSRHTPEFATNQELQRHLRRIKQLAEKNANMLTEILYDYTGRIRTSLHIASVLS